MADDPDDPADTVYLTRALLSVLLETAGDREPESVSVGLATTSARDLDGPGPDLPPETPVFTHVYWPVAGRSVSAVFGVDLGTPPGRTPGRFVSHPDGSIALSRTDDFREVVLVAVPPWTAADVVAYGRNGRRRPLHVVDAHPPEESLP